MQLTAEQVKKIGKLARISLNEEEIQHYSQELSNILDWVEQLQEVPTDNVKPMTGVADMQLPWRADEVKTGNDVEGVLANAPHTEYGYFLVPTVIE